jgi:hypothetical protein
VCAACKEGRSVLLCSQGECCEGVKLREEQSDLVVWERVQCPWGVQREWWWAGCLGWVGTSVIWGAGEERWTRLPVVVLLCFFSFSTLPSSHS